MNKNTLDADSLFTKLQQITYCSTGRDIKQEQDILTICENHGFDRITIEQSYKTKDQRDLINDGKGLFSKLSRDYPKGLYVAHHPYGSNRYPDFFILINGHILELEAKTASSTTPKFTHGDTLIDPSKRSAIYIFTHKHDGTELLLSEHLMSVDNYFLIIKQKKDRDELQRAHDVEFAKVCKGKGEKLYCRPNIVPMGGQEYTNHIGRAREHNLSQKVLYLLKTYE